ncbi:hypothetical protein FRB93_002135 [Tulasnella sp. JGI-2019a]|nr:hypothetical protein FRB93_002135 [Tulasnella sp. JGI-2019a]
MGGALQVDPLQILVYLKGFVEYAPTSQLVRYSQLAAFTAMFYDWTLNLGDEINYVWRRKWTFGTAIYAFTRYFAYGFQFFDVITCLTKGLTQLYCTSYFWILVSCSTIMLFIVQLTLQFRVHAMYHCDRRLLIFNSIFYGGVIVGTASFIIFAGPSVTAFPAPRPSSGCWGIVPTYLFVAWLPGLVFDAWLCFLVVRKARQHTRDQESVNRKQNFLKLLVLDSVVWFGLILILIIWNSADLASGVNGVNIIGLSFFHSGVNIGGSRLILNMRQAYFKAKMKKVKAGILGQVYPLRPGQLVPGVGARIAPHPNAQDRATIYVQPRTPETAQTPSLGELAYDGRSPPSTATTGSFPGSSGSPRSGGFATSRQQYHNHERGESSATYVNMDEETIIGEYEAKMQDGHGDGGNGMEMEIIAEDQEAPSTGPVSRQPSRVQLQQFHRPILTHQMRERSEPQYPQRAQTQQPHYRKPAPPLEQLSQQMGLLPRPRVLEHQHSSANGRSVPDLKPPPQYRRPNPDRTYQHVYVKQPDTSIPSEQPSPSQRPAGPSQEAPFQIQEPVQKQERAPRPDRHYPNPESEHHMEIALQTDIVVIVDGPTPVEGDGMSSFARGPPSEATPPPEAPKKKKKKKKKVVAAPLLVKKKQIVRPSTAPTPGPSARSEEGGSRVGGRIKGLEPLSR